MMIRDESERMTVQKQWEIVRRWLARDGKMESPADHPEAPFYGQIGYTWDRSITVFASNGTWKTDDVWEVPIRWMKISDSCEPI